MDFETETCAGFAAALASDASVPGGGGAAAYVGALGAALGQMVGNFTLGKERYADVQDDVERLCAQAEDVRLRLIELVDEDARAFEPLSKAYALPKDDPSRAGVLEAAAKGACEPPMGVVRECCKAIDMLEEMEAKGSRMLLSDVGCGAALCRGAMEAAAMNVYVNTQGLGDTEFADGLNAELDALLEEYEAKAVAIEERVARKLRS